MKRIKHTFITLGLASGMTAAALAYMHNLPTCRAMVLHEVASNQQFLDSVQFEPAGSFHAALGGK